MLIIVTFVLYFIYIILVIKFGRKLFKKVFAWGHAKEWILYLLTAAASWFLLEFLPPLYQSNSKMLLAVMFFVIWSFIILLFAIVNTHERMKQKYDADFSRDIIATGREHYQRMNEQFDALRIMKHDYKFHLKSALDMLEKGNLEKSKTYLSGLHEKIENKELPNFCGNVVINSLVSDYARKCKELNIDFNVSILIPDGFNVPNYEMCIVLGNLLENAVEACQKLDDNRQIKLVLKPKGEQLILMVRNTFDGEVVLDEEKIVSTKKDDSGGIGLDSVKAVVDRFGEMFRINYDSEFFSVFVLWK
jgi:signal transduction histidine kinase